jgi:hypothetical protein
MSKTKTGKTPPSAFISYSHDSLEHKKWVLDLATRLRTAGVDAVLDQWELGPGSDIPHFMEQHLAKADRVLMICTDHYVKKANSGVGGVGYEKMIVTADLIKTIDSNKVIPIIRQAGTHNVPTFLKTKLFLDFSTTEQSKFSFDELVRSLHNAPLFVKPPLGNSPLTAASEAPAKKTGDPILRLMKIVVRHFEGSDDGDEYFSYVSILHDWGASRLMLDAVIEDAKRAGLITQDSDLDLRITTKGKQFAIEQGWHE